PSPYKVKRMVDKIDPETQKPVKGKDGKIIKEEKEIVVPAYRMVTVFDVSQTEGRELPTIGVNELTGAVDGYDSFLKALDKSCPVPIKFKEIEGKAKGYFSLTENEIAVKQGMSEIQTVKTIIHEMAHQKLHSGLDAVKQTRSSKEVEAESIAYVVSQHYGIDTSDYSFSYVVGWSDGKETTELKNSLDVIRKTASEMISDIDGALEEIHLVNSRDKNTKISVLTNLHDKQERIRKESDRSSLSFTKTKNNQDYVKESRKDIQL
ncbi:MAG: antirestriction protein, partial [Lachnospiraceae bacterium]|nr:antirestriction protein [Lachnospiraceae bacterium]